MQGCRGVVLASVLLTALAVNVHAHAWLTRPLQRGGTADNAGQLRSNYCGCSNCDGDIDVRDTVNPGDTYNVRWPMLHPNDNQQIQIFIGGPDGNPNAGWTELVSGPFFENNLRGNTASIDVTIPANQPPGVVAIRFVWEFVGEGNTYMSCGNIEVLGNTPECTVGSDCDDNDACTTDTCNGGTCSNTAITCNDNDACTTDSCSSNTGCVYTPLNTPACNPECTVGSDCDDNDACTTDTCSGGTCSNTAITTGNCASAIACTLNSECDDNDACTSDLCSNGLCSYQATDCTQQDGNGSGNPEPASAEDSVMAAGLSVGGAVIVVAAVAGLTVAARRSQERRLSRRLSARSNVAAREAKKPPRQISTTVSGRYPSPLPSKGPKHGKVPVPGPSKGKAKAPPLLPKDGSSIGHRSRSAGPPRRPAHRQPGGRARTPAKKNPGAASRSRSRI